MQIMLHFLLSLWYPNRCWNWQYGMNRAGGGLLYSDEAQPTAQRDPQFNDHPVAQRKNNRVIRWITILQLLQTLKTLSSKDLGVQIKTSKGVNRGALSMQGVLLYIWLVNRKKKQSSWLHGQAGTKLHTVDYRTKQTIWRPGATSVQSLSLQESQNTFPFSLASRNGINDIIIKLFSTVRIWSPVRLPNREISDTNFRRQS